MEGATAEGRDDGEKNDDMVSTCNEAYFMLTLSWTQ